MVCNVAVRACLLLAVLKCFLSSQTMQPEKMDFENISEIFSRSIFLTRSCSFGQREADTVVYEGDLNLLEKHFVPWKGRSVTQKSDLYITHMTAVAGWKNFRISTGQGHRLFCTESTFQGRTLARAAFQGIYLSLRCRTCSEGAEEQPLGWCY